jgi:hypothetical protein
MRRAVLAGVACAVVVLARPGSTQVNTMPGQVVGTGFGLSSVGQQVPKAAPPAGQPINLPADSPMMRRYDPSRPYDVFKGTNLSPDQLAAPIEGYGDQSVLSKLYQKLKSVVGFGPPKLVSAQQNSTYFPSLTRRNRERAEQRLWRRD